MRALNTPFSFSFFFVKKLTVKGIIGKTQGVRSAKNPPIIPSKNILNKFKPNFILNFASETHVDRSIYDPEIFFKTNVLNTLKFIEETRKYLSDKNFRSKRS